MSSYLDNQLPDDQRRQFEEHLSSCKTCNKSLEEFSSLDSYLKESTDPLPDEAYWTGFNARLAQRIDKVAKKAPWWKAIFNFTRPLSWVVVALMIAVGIMTPSLRDHLFGVSEKERATFSTPTSVSAPKISTDSVDKPVKQVETEKPAKSIPAPSAAPLATAPTAAVPPAVVAPAPAKISASESTSKAQTIAKADLVKKEAPKKAIHGTDNKLRRNEGSKALPETDYPKYEGFKDEDNTKKHSPDGKVVPPPQLKKTHISASPSSGDSRSGMKDEMKPAMEAAKPKPAEPSALGGAYQPRRAAAPKASLIRENAHTNNITGNVQRDVQPPAPAAAPAAPAPPGKAPGVISSSTQTPSFANSQNSNQGAVSNIQPQTLQKSYGKGNYEYKAKKSVPADKDFKDWSENQYVNSDTQKYLSRSEAILRKIIKFNGTQGELDILKRDIRNSNILNDINKNYSNITKDPAVANHVKEVRWIISRVMTATPDGMEDIKKQITDNNLLEKTAELKN
jgi:anti-sigma factor RsiW